MYTGADYHHIQLKITAAMNAVNDALMALSEAERATFGDMKVQCHRCRQDLITIQSRMVKTLRIAALPPVEEPMKGSMTYEVVMHALGPKKIQVIKAIRSFTKLGLKEAKELAERPPPCQVWTVKDDYEAAAQIVRMLRDAGANAACGVIQ